MNSQFNNGSFTDFNYLFFNLSFCFFHYFLNTGRVNTAIGYQTLQRKTGNFTAKGIKRRKYNGFRGIIHDQVNPGSCFHSPDISSFPADDLALDFITFQVENRNGIFNGLFCSCTLNALDNDFTGFFIGFLTGIVNNFLLKSQGLGMGFLLSGFR